MFNKLPKLEKLLPEGSRKPAKKILGGVLLVIAVGGLLGLENVLAFLATTASLAFLGITGYILVTQNG